MAKNFEQLDRNCFVVNSRRLQVHLLNSLYSVLSSPPNKFCCVSHSKISPATLFGSETSKTLIFLFPIQGRISGLRSPPDGLNTGTRPTVGLLYVCHTPMKKFSESKNRDQYNVIGLTRYLYTIIFIDSGNKLSILLIRRLIILFLDTLN